MNIGSRKLRLRHACWLIALSCVLHACRSTLPQRSRSVTLLAQPLAFKYLQLSASLRYQDQEYQCSNAYVRIRMQRDAIIWFSVTTPLGVEIIRGAITPDGVTILNRAQQVCYTYTYATLSTCWGCHVSYAWIQTVLLGEFFLPPASQEIIHQCLDKAVVQQQQYPWILTYIVNGALGKLEKLVALDVLTRCGCVVAYQGLKQRAAVLPFRQAHVQWYRSLCQGLAETTLTLSRIRARCSSKPLKFPFKIPSKYVKK